MDEEHATYLRIEGKYILAGGTTTRERELTTWVMDVAKATGWKVYHVPDSRRAPSGFPDLVLLNPPHLLFVELKRDGHGGKLTALQKEWISALHECGQEAVVWRPSDVPHIWEQLTGDSFKS